jgi:hydrogenase/urease accessory protein HupE
MFTRPRSLLALALSLAAGLVALAAPRPAQAHPLQVEPVIVTIYPQQTFLSAIITGNIQDITVGCNITPAEHVGDAFTKPAEARVEKYINDHFQMKLDGVPLTGRLTEFSYQAQMDPTKSRYHLSLRYDKAAKAAGKGVLTLTSSLFDYLPNSKTVISINGVQKTLMHDEATTIDPSQLAVNLLHNLYDFCLLGINHIFTGPDHMLFIVGLLLVSANLHGLIKTLTGFTIAHSITLALSALSIVVIPNRICDIFIALSIIYVGVENLFYGTLRGVNIARHRFWIASSFGLVHGFGFSDTLREVGLPQQGLAWCLLSFNAGVEIAQVTICCLVFPLLMLWRRDVDKRAQYGGMSWPTVIRVCSMWVVLMGGYWLIQRTVG